MNEMKKQRTLIASARQMECFRPNGYGDTLQSLFFSHPKQRSAVSSILLRTGNGEPQFRLKFIKLGSGCQ